MRGDIEGVSIEDVAYVLSRCHRLLSQASESLEVSKEELVYVAGLSKQIVDLLKSSIKKGDDLNNNKGEVRC